LGVGAVPLALGAVLLLAAVLRGWGLTSKSLWYDEAFAVFVARQPLTEMIGLLRDFDMHPPFHYVFLHVWMRLVGDGEVAVRLPGVLASVCAVLFTFLLGRRLGGTRVGVLAATLLALSPFQIAAAQEARMYPFLTLFGVASSYALWLALEGGSRRHWIAYALVTTLSLYTHHFTILLLLAHGAYVLGIHRLRAGGRAWLLCAVVAVAAYLPQLSVFFQQLVRARGWPSFEGPFGLGLVADVMGLLSFGGGTFGMGTYYRGGTLALPYRVLMVLPFLWLAVRGVGKLGERQRQAYLLAYFLVPLLLAAAISLQWNIFQERYFSFLLPPFVMLLAAGMLAVADRARPSARAAPLVGAVGLLSAALMTPSLLGVYRDQPSYDWRGAARHLTTAAGPSDFVHYLPSFVSIPFDYYFREDRPRLPGTPRDVLAVVFLAGQRKLSLRSGLPPEAMETASRTHPRLWLITSAALGDDVHRQIGTVLSASFQPGEVRRFGLVRVALWKSRHYTPSP
ncbi:MAG: glycosyltransferase family 39 protein, partial [Gemmatimonadales bacterium]